MSKRTAKEKLIHYREKIKRLEQIYDSSSSEDEDVVMDPDGPILAHDPIIQEPQRNIENPEPEHNSSVPMSDHNNGIIVPENQADLPMSSAQPELAPDMLLALGESTEDTPEYGENIHDNLTKLWSPLLKKGMTTEARDKILKDYLVPDNCRLLQAPKLNVEISAAVPDMVRNRDKNLAATQQQLGNGIAAINRAMDILIKCADPNGIRAMKHLSNGCRILCDIHASLTQNRIKLITPSLDKSFLQVIQDTERDETLFGNKLAEKIKAAKTIEKQGLQIKKTSPKKPATAQPSTNRASYSGNWTAPPRYASNRGGRRGARRQASYSRRALPDAQPAKAAPATKTSAQTP
ncbi:uncharacterized protein LOC125240853 [Leguminivora glycinivorella]|uniref:uncharacterized protein LOC125234409 n=1 Tax=Leguminivora glycinivorella TaxID=1035111 RepID=UPI00200C506E|nr:uncharacterized protein LOC125234409 [Leguminivora glycinivorella]XP_048004952.1 uncharacterized protein LOC125240853 [Leguminivora glycinivorella]